MKRLLEEGATQFERLLLVSADLDLPPDGAAAACLASFDVAPAVPILRSKKVGTSAWLLLAAAFLGVTVLVFERTRQREPVVITHETVSVPTNQPTPVASPEPAMQLPPPATASVSIIPSRPSASPSVTVVRRPAPSSVPSARPAARGDAPFDKGAAAAALGAIDVSTCATADGPTGQGHVTVTFSPDGTVAVAKVDDGTFAGTAVGGCIAAKFRAATVPPFSGNLVRVGKTFTIAPP